jgi:dienelactone hydrolase
MHLRLSALAALLAVLAFAPAAGAAPAPFGHACQPSAGTLFCPGADDAARVPSFDGVPLEVDVWLPATGDGPFPTIAMLHGFGGSKTNFQDPARQPTYNARYFARHGYAVVLPMARGFGRSCGTPDSRARVRARLDPPRRPALRDPRRPVAAGDARRRGVARAGALGVTGSPTAAAPR